MTSSSSEQPFEKIRTPRENSEAWLEMQGPNYASEFASKANIPDMSALIPDDVFTTLVPAMAELSKAAANVAANMLPVDEIAGNLKMLVQSPGMDVVSKRLLESHAETMKGLYPSFDVLAQTALMPQMRESLSMFAKYVAASVDTSHLQSVLTEAASLREKLGEQDVDELTDQFFASHPDLAESLEQSPALYALSKADRRLIVWLVGIIITLYVGSTLLNFGTDNPELKAIIDAFGLDFGGGVPAGLTAAGLTNEALDKLPQEESE